MYIFLSQLRLKTSIYSLAFHSYHLLFYDIFIHVFICLKTEVLLFYNITIYKYSLVIKIMNHNIYATSFPYHI